jgi:hypothetical protein
MTNHTRIAALALLLFSGCAVGELDTGAVELELSAPGPDGSTYHLLPGTALEIRGVSNPSFIAQVPIDVAGPSLNVRCPSANTWSSWSTPSRS